MNLSDRISLSVAMDMYAAGLAVNADGDYQAVANMIEYWVAEVRKLEAVVDAGHRLKSVHAPPPLCSCSECTYTRSLYTALEEALQSHSDD